MRPELLALLNQYGDRSTSWVSAYDHFEEFEKPHGAIRYHKLEKTWMAAAEPLSANKFRAQMFEELTAKAALQKKSLLMLPISESLATELKALGTHTFPVGAEPVFDLRAFFDSLQDPLQKFPIARSLKLKGARVDMKKISECTEEELSQMRVLFETWKTDKGARAMGFLSAVDPFQQSEEKTYFLLNYRGKIEVFLTALPVKPKNAVYFADWIRSSKIRPGSMELLMIESMRELKQAGILEARLGLCPCANLEMSDFEGIRQKILGLGMKALYRFGSYPYSLQGLYSFKSKLQPTSWEKLYAASSQKVGFWVLGSIFEAHFGKTLLQNTLQWLRQQFTHAIPIREAPKTFTEILARSKLTLASVAIMSMLHIFRMSTEAGKAFYAANGFIAKNFDFTGYLIGPLLHDNTYHFLGDLSTFLIIGAVCEVFFGKILLATLIALGFWATNPIAAASLAPFVPSVLAERDYGSSNAIYAFAGALAACSLKPRLILLPFLINGLMICNVKSSWLAMHHWVGLFLGYATIRLMQKYQKKS